MDIQLGSKNILLAIFFSFLDFLEGRKPEFVISSVHVLLVEVAGSVVL